MERGHASAAREAVRLDRLEALRLLDDLLWEFRAGLASGLSASLERECAPLLSAATEGRFSRILVDGDFNVRMADGLRECVLGRFSGGEQDLAAVVLRLGLLRLAARRRAAGFVILDEVFGSQDRLRRRGLLDGLRRLCPPFRQIFVVTHAEDVQDLLPSVLRADAGGIAVESSLPGRR